MSLERKLALLALALGVGALFGEPHMGQSVRIDADELAAIVEGEVDHVTTPELADWIIQQRLDYRLIDLRSAADYADYHIPTAENVAITGLTTYPLERNEKILLYSNGGIHSAQAWFLLRARGYRGAYILLGGLQAWQDEVLFPVLLADATEQQHADFERMSAISLHFGGQPRVGVPGGDQFMSSAPVMQLPKVEAPAMVPAMSRRKRGPKQGC
jgi:rhodanese-related sulfurtransferase